MMRQVLYTKLFIVMGIAWIFECVHHLVHSDHHHCGHAGLELIFRLIGCLNLLRGSLIFFIFVCKDSILDKVSSKYLLKYLDRVDIYPLDNVISPQLDALSPQQASLLPVVRQQQIQALDQIGSNSGPTFILKCMIDILGSLINSLSVLLCTLVSVLCLGCLG